MKRLFKLILVTFFIVSSIFISNQMIHADEETSGDETPDIEEMFEVEAADDEELPENEIQESADSKAYAVLTSSGDLIFFRSNNAYTNNTVKTVKDIYNNTYEGTVFAGIETTTNSPEVVPWRSKKSSIKRVYVAEDQTIYPKCTGYWFMECKNMTSFDGRGLDTSNVTSMDSMFSSCFSLASIDVSTFNTKNVKDMEDMFALGQNGSDIEPVNRSVLKTLDLSSFNTSNVQCMAGMFYNCSSLKTLILGNFNTANVTSMTSMFWGCTSLKSLDLSSFKTSKTENMSKMFYYCSSLSSLDLSSFDTSKTEDMSAMFANCSSLMSLDLSKFNTSNTLYMDDIFHGCSSLKFLDIHTFDTSKADYTHGMFTGCSSLVSVKLGRHFTVWNSNAYLPAGTWTNRDAGLIKTEKELYEGYPSNAETWRGTWRRAIPEQEYVRIYGGAEWYESIKVAEEFRNATDLFLLPNIIIAKDSDFADALSGSYLAARKFAPILLTGEDNFEDIYDYISGHVKTDGTIYILGSSSAVPLSFEEELSGSYNVKRLQGSSRFMTNLEILKEAGMTETGDIIVVTGSGYADSLSSGAAGLPILMVDNKNTSLKKSQKDFLKKNVKGNIYILGDENAVNASLEKELKAYGPVTRIGGSSRWETTRKIAEKFFASPSGVILATGNDFADGLIASPLAYVLHTPLLLASSDKTYQAKLYVEKNAIKGAYIIGSKDYISDEAARKILLLSDDMRIVEK